jgi:lipoprotein-anchoring transpeptidase ErfK/SrfK
MRRRGALVTTVGVALLIVALLALRPEKTTAAAPPATVTTTPVTIATTTTAPMARAFLAADAIAQQVPVYAAPGDATPVVVLTNPTPERVPLTLSVKEQGPPAFVKVQYNRRPNGAIGYVPASTVQLRTVENRIVVGVAAKTLTVYKGTSDVVLFQVPVATGLPQTPTPLGDFYIDTIVKLTRPTGAYGPYQLSVAGFSDVLQSFAGGAGQIAIHGTNRPQLIGQEASNGCVRLNNDDVTALVPLAPPGTPVSIIA